MKTTKRLTAAALLALLLLQTASCASDNGGTVEGTADGSQTETEAITVDPKAQEKPAGLYKFWEDPKNNKLTTPTGLLARKWSQGHRLR